MNTTLNERICTAITQLIAILHNDNVGDGATLGRTRDGIGVTANVYRTGGKCDLIGPWQADVTAYDYRREAIVPLDVPTTYGHGETACEALQDLRRVFEAAQQRAA